MKKDLSVLGVQPELEFDADGLPTFLPSDEQRELDAVTAENALRSVRSNRVGFFFLNKFGVSLSIFGVSIVGFFTGIVFASAGPLLPSVSLAGFAGILASIGVAGGLATLLTITENRQFAGVRQMHEQRNKALADWFEAQEGRTLGENELAALRDRLTLPSREERQKSEERQAAALAANFIDGRRTREIASKPSSSFASQSAVSLMPEQLGA